MLWDLCENVRRKGRLDFRNAAQASARFRLPRRKFIEGGHVQHGIVRLVPRQTLHGGARWVVTGADDGLTGEAGQDRQGLPVLVNPTAREVITTHAAITREQEVTGHDVPSNVDDHRIVRVTRGMVETNGMRTNRQRVLLAHQAVDAEGGG